MSTSALGFLRQGLLSQLHKLSGRSHIRLCSATTTTTTLPDNPDFTMENPYQKEKQQCILCKMNLTPNYKNVRLLSQFQSRYTGRIYGRHITGLCRAKQGEVEREIKKAQTAALMPGYHKDVKFLNDPALFNPERPIRPHKY